MKAMMLKRGAGLQERQIMYRMAQFLRLITGVLVFVFGIIFGFANSAPASLLFSSYTGENLTNNSNFTIGTEFTVGSDALQVTSLGAYDGSGDGLSASHQVGIWRVSDQTLVGSGTVPSGTAGTLIEDWRFVDVTLFTLQANTTYRIGGEVTGDPDPFSTGTFTNDSTISVTAGSVASNVGSGFGFPNRDLSDPRVFANAQVTIPEPTALFFFGVGLLGVGIGTWRHTERKALGA